MQTFAFFALETKVRNREKSVASVITRTDAWIGINNKFDRSHFIIIIYHFDFTDDEGRMTFKTLRSSIETR